MSATLDELRRPQEATPQPNVSRMASVGRTVSQATAPHPHPHHRRLAVVIAEGDLFDAALVALVEGAGYGATLVEPAQIRALRNPAVLLVRSTGMLALVRRAPMLRNVRVVFLGDGSRAATTSASRPAHPVPSPHSARRSPRPWAHPDRLLRRQPRTGCA